MGCCILWGFLAWEEKERDEQARSAFGSRRAEATREGLRAWRSQEGGQKAKGEGSTGSFSATR